MIKITNYTANRECVFLAAAGFSYAFISARTGLTYSQISYRLKKTSTSVKEYRNGGGLIARAVLSEVERQKIIRTNIKRRLPLLLKH